MGDFVIVSEKINKYFEKELTNCGLIVIKVRKNRKLYTAIESHPDIALCSVGKTIVVEADTYNYLSEELINCAYNVIKTESIKSGVYPESIGLNLAYTGKFAIHNFKYTDKKLYEALKKKEDSLKFIDIKQGYSKCSILIVDNNSIITSDEGIYDSIKEVMNCLLIKKGNIKLSTLDYGFIGGASGRYKDEIWFYGDVSEHPDYKRIKTFIEDRNLKVKYFEEFELEDMGSLLFFENT
ncbi:MAG: DUF6873 family GME fold protein [Acidaminobacteraceae bacterium]